MIALQAVRSKFIECKRLAVEVTDLIDDLEPEKVEIACEKAEGILRLVPRVLASLGDQFTKPFVETVVEALKVCARACRERASNNVATLAELKAMTKMLHEATTVFPFDADLGGDLSELGNSLAEKSRGDRIANLMEALGCVTSGATLMKNITSLQERLGAAIGAKLDEKATKAAHRVIDIAATFVSASLPDPKDVDIEALLEFSDGLVELLPEAARPATAQVFPLARCAVRLASAMTAMVKECYAEGQVKLKIAERATTVKQAQVFIEQANAAVQADNENEVVKSMLGFLQEAANEAQSKLTEIWEALAAATKEELQKYSEKLADIGQGMKGGKDWLEGLSNPDKGNWKKLKARADNTLCKETEVAGLRPVIDGVEKVVRSLGVGGGHEVRA